CGDPPTERRQRDERLEGRPRRILGLDGPVEQRVVRRRRRQPLVLLGGQAVLEDPRVVGGRRRHRQDLAVLGVLLDQRAGVRGQIVPRRRVVGVPRRLLPEGKTPLRQLLDVG